MKLLSSDLLEQANILYEIVKINDTLPIEDLYYIEDMH